MKFDIVLWDLRVSGYSFYPYYSSHEIFTKIFMNNDIGEVLISEAEIKKRVSALAQKLAVDYKHKNLTIRGM
ncbi:MAG: hypothetical protein NUV44_05425 [Candidatus Scalindua sp.]|nr:hypothetical protein [Candidatus Scalindua sp.]